jgi:hypothetical protein
LIILRSAFSFHDRHDAYPTNSHQRSFASISGFFRL